MSLKGKASFLQIINEILTRFPIPARDILAWQQEHHHPKGKMCHKTTGPLHFKPTRAHEYRLQTFPYNYL